MILVYLVISLRSSKVSVGQARYGNSITQDRSVSKGLVGIPRLGDVGDHSTSDIL